MTNGEVVEVRQAFGRNWVCPALLDLEERDDKHASMQQAAH